MSTTTRRPNFAYQAPPSEHAMHRALTSLAELRDRLLAIDPSMADEPDLFHDMMEGEDTENALGKLDALIRVMIDTEELAANAKQRKAEIAARQAMFETHAEKMRDKIVEVMDILGLRRRVQDDFTVYPGNRKGGIKVGKPELLPSKFLRFKDPEPDLTAIGKAYHAGEDIPGEVSRSNGSRTLTVKVGR